MAGEQWQKGAKQTGLAGRRRQRAADVARPGLGQALTRGALRGPDSATPGRRALGVGRSAPGA